MGDRHRSPCCSLGQRPVFNLLQVLGHPRGPFHRIDILHSSQQLRIELAGQVVPLPEQGPTEQEVVADATTHSVALDGLGATGTRLAHIPPAWSSVTPTHPSTATSR